MRNHARHGLFLMVLLIAAGCDRKPVIIKFTCAWPSSAAMADNSIAAPLERKIIMSVGVEKVTAISTKAGTDFYITGTTQFSGSEMLANVKRGFESAERELPQGAAITKIVQLNRQEAIPVVQPREIDELSVNIDGQKSARLGVTTAAIAAAVKPIFIDSPATEETVKRAAVLPIATVDGKQVTLGDVATVKLVKAPDTVVRTFP